MRGAPCRCPSPPAKISVMRLKYLFRLGVELRRLLARLAPRSPREAEPAQLELFPEGRPQENDGRMVSRT